MVNKLLKNVFKEMTFNQIVQHLLATYEGVISLLSDCHIFLSTSQPIKVMGI